uniref:Uncharacterized protein n=1 Tax=Echeneis naucrates TaxID=173247 RepID=A0A665WKQ0_ECHNA
FVRQHQEEVRIALEKRSGQTRGWLEERVISAADAEHWQSHLIGIPQGFIPLPVTVPVLGWYRQSQVNYLYLSQTSVPKEFGVSCFSGTL